MMDEKRLKEAVKKLSIQVQKISKKYDCYITMNSHYGDHASADIQLKNSSDYIGLFDGEEV